MVTLKERIKHQLTLRGWPILFLGLLATSFMTCYIYMTTQLEDKIRFEYQADQIIKKIQYRMDRYEGALVQTRAFLLSSEDVSREEFHEYFVKTRLIERYPGILGLGLARKLDPSELSNHIRKTKKIYPDYEIWPKGKRDIYTSVVYLEPLDAMNQRALGYDMYTDPTRQAAMKRAWETGLPAISGKLFLVQESTDDPQPGFNYYIPFYKDDVNLDTKNERLKSLWGFIYSPFRAHDLFNAVFADDLMDVDIEVFDGAELTQESMLYDYDGKRQFLQDHDGSMRLVRRIEIAGRTFSFHFVPTHHFKRKFSVLFPALSALAGILITLLIYRIFWITRRQVEVGQEAEAALKEAVLARDEFLSIASHELKTPLTSLKLQAQVIRRSMEREDQGAFSKERMKSLVDQTDRQTLRLERLVDDMLDISRIRTGRLTIEKEEFDLCELVKDVIGRMQEQFKHIPGEYPILNLCDESQGYWDKMRIEQVITNLLTNAIKYGENKEIEVHILATSDKVILKVKDQGKGISPEFQEKIFNRFERAGISPTEISGLGLGLFITKQIVLSHQGKIWVESEKGKGSTFILELPRYA